LSLVTGHWLLVTGYWLLVTGNWLLVGTQADPTGIKSEPQNRRISNIECRRMDSLCSVFILNRPFGTKAHDRQNTLFDVGRSMFDVRPARNASKAM
jgi:hypothetical protein